MHASVNVSWQGKSGAGKIHEVILVQKLVPSKDNFNNKKHY